MATQRQVKAALEQYGDQLMARPNVVGVGIVQETPVGQKSARKQPVLAVYVSQKPRQSGPGKIPDSVKLSSPRSTAVIPVRVIEQGPLSLEG